MLLDRNGVVRYISAGAGMDRKIAELLKGNANPVTTARGVFEKKAALDNSGDEPAKPAVATAPVAAAPPKANAPTVAEQPPRTNTPPSTKPAPASTPVAPVAATATAPGRAPESKLGDHTISVKNITITAKRSTALLQIGPTTYTVAPGTELVFPSGGKQLKARCTEIDRSTVVLAIEGQEAPLRLVLP